MFLTHYEANQGPGMVTFAAKLPGHIKPIDVTPGQAYFVHRHGWLCGTPGISRASGCSGRSAAACGAATASCCKSRGQGRA